ncbi:putative nucleotidyltransferase, Ribonuclease H [Helianthus annuus]|uniref:Nucleotidyltransferase, Ribonuclease H n=1 Tax=Helianthus annuus TaxID=4232 RepID=A0A9K3HCA6_HELAN|nr:putative nucleotidyltransferase, Ribonuclease H [Helianthus annuus]KAJ0478329.1 putative nucleotidyltransferase, Ribonuclease H [Helianthus annuus]KAJ0483054.1 putative nucleotidyltransferase, Ribonuclease H [Helianthus annuus]KAJ0499213.1 putative nucleotidyltransferase, Ribonuclease H [Helianthus annuus]KAJ0665229.1 putative nucleotidyltransferase, Ribonuclease H [Helianthus annuus]
MADGTRLKTLDSDVKALQDGQAQTTKTVDQLLASQARQEKLLAEVVAQLSRMPGKTPDLDPSGSHTHRSDGYSVLGRHKPAPVTLARFSGSHPERWVAQATRYFEFYSIPDDERLTISSFYFDDAASDWFDWLQRHHQLTTWDAFVGRIQKRFRTPELEDPEGQLAKLHQTSTVADYRNRFEEISNRTVLLPRTFLVSCFISGLRGDIKQSVVVHNPQTLDDAAELAQKHEQRILLEKGLGRVSLGSSKGLLPTPKTPPTVGSPVTPAQLKAISPNVGFRRLSPAEIATKRSQGLCFRCDERYTWDHKCKAAPQLLFFDDDSSDFDSDAAQISPNSVLQDGQIAEKLQMEEVKTQSSISYNALSGDSSSTTLRFSGTVQGKTVQILLDGGSTHCFVQTRVAQFLNFAIEAITPFSVLVGSGDRLLCSGIARKVELIVQNHSIVVDFYVLPLQGWDMVLGVSWLATLGPVVTDYKLGTFKFQLQGKQVCWQGDSSPPIHPIQFHGFQQLLHNDGIGHIFHLTLLPPNTTATKPHSPELQSVLDQFAMVFQPPHGLPPPRAQDHCINLLPSSNPVSIKPYRYPHFQKNEIERLVSEMLAQGIIRPSTSAFSSPVLLVKKKDGTWRFCVDYRALNAITIRDRFPIPSIDELFDELYNAKVFSKLDLLAGYHQIRVAPGDISKTAFRTHDGHFEFLVMPFGLTNAPSTFQRLMNDVFRPYLRKFILVFFDDILVYSPSWTSHLAHLTTTLQLLLDNQLVAKMSKCVFGQNQIAYLGHIITGQGVAVDPSKIEAILQWPTPSNVKEVRAFLGLTGYYRRFIHNYATIAGPLTDLLRKDAYAWTDTTKSAFTKLKQLLGSTPVLRLPDFSKPFTLETDASGTGIGAILSQDKHPLAYFSKKLCPRMQQASTYHREMYAITQAIAKWRQYLLGNKFTILTDQQSLKNLQDQVIQTPEQQKWLGKLLGFDFDILYRPGSLNSAADALSRQPTSQLMAISSQEPSLLLAIRKAILTDPESQSILLQISQKSAGSDKFQVKEGLLFYQGRLFVPVTANLRSQLLTEFHSSVIGGHSGITRTLHRLSSNFYWPNMRSDVSTFIAECQVCQQTKASPLSPAGLLQPLPIPHMIFDEIAMDFITSLPSSHGKTVIMVVIDRLSKYGHFIGLPANFSSVTVATAFINDFVRLHGVPTNIVTDRDARFMTSFWKELHRLHGTTLSFSTAYHPQSDGQTEALNKCLEMYLRAYVTDYPTHWMTYLPWAEFWYNTAYQTSAQMTPFEVVYGRKPPTINRYIRDSTTNATLEAQLLDRDTVLSLLRANLAKAQTRMKLQADKHRRELSFDIGDWVYVKLQPYRQGSLRLQRHRKLGRRYFGPYQVIQKIGSVAYRLDLPPTAQIHSVFHVSVLRKCVGQPTQQVTPLNLVDSTSTLLLIPHQILARRSIIRSGQTIPQSLIQWEGFSEQEATWEDDSHLLHKFPSFHLADKVILDGDGNVMDPGPAARRISNRPKQVSRRLHGYDLNATSAEI